jgi:hypothetical protein
MVGSVRTQPPGIEASSDTFENNILWPGYFGEYNAPVFRGTINSASLDVGNTGREALLRQGIVMSLLPDGSLIPYDDTNQNIFGILPDSLNMAGRYGGTPVTKYANVLVGGNVYKSNIELVNADEFAIAALKSIGFVFDDDDQRGNPGTTAYVDTVITGGIVLDSTTPGAINATGTGAAVTLPSIATAASKQYEILSSIVGTVITSAEGGNIVGDGSITGSTVTLGIGEVVLIRAIKLAGVLKWQAIVLAGVPVVA